MTRTDALFEAQVFAFLDKLRAAGGDTVYAPQVVREFGITGDRAMVLCAKWINKREREEWQV
ncbi:MAG TPA: hypothetical protein VJN70_12570 [Gemmatimonadaceae bacterium]|nr:hypothetical protein [Gemmatimonadaceae bacterium]